MLERKAYTIQDIQQWEKELDSIPKNIANLKSAITQRQTKISTDDASLNEVKAKIQPMDKNLEALHARLDILELESTLPGLHKSLDSHQETLKSLGPQLEAVDTKLTPVEAEINRLNRLIAIKEAKQSIAIWLERYRAFSAEADQFNRQVVTEDNRLSMCQANISSLSSEVSNLEFRQSMDNVGHASGGYGHHHHHHHHHHGHHHDDDDRSVGLLDAIGGIMHAVGDVALASRLSSKRNELAEANSRYNQLLRNRNQLNRQANAARQQADEAHSQIRALEYRLTQYNSAEQSQADAAALDGLRVELNTQVSRRTPLLGQQSELKRKIHSENVTINTDSATLRANESRIQFLVPSSLPYKDINDKNDLRKQIDVQEKEKSPLSSEQTRLVDAIQQGQQQTIAENQLIDNLQRQEANMQQNQLLYTLHTNPGVLVKGLAASLEKQLNEYEVNHPAKQSLMVRTCLVECPEVLRAIQANSALSTSDQVEGLAIGGDRHTIEKMQFYRTYGYLCEMIKKLDANNEDRVFADIIKGHINQYALDAADMQSEYNRFCRQANVQHFNLASLNDLESKNYQKTYAALQRSLASLPDNQPALKQLKQAGMDILNEMQTIEPLCNIKLRTTMLTKTLALLQNPQDVALQDDYRKFARHIEHGKPSLAKKICGALLAFLGAVVLVVSIAAKVCTMGVSAPVSTAGIAVGAVALVTGYGLFRSGKHKGMSKNFASFNEAAKNVTSAPSSLSLFPAAEEQPGLVSTSGGGSAQMSRLVVIEPSAPALTA